MKSKVILFLSAATLALSPIRAPAQQINGVGSASVVIVKTVPAEFTVKLPTVVELSDTKVGCEFSGKIGVKGNLALGEKLKVTPDKKVLLYDVSNRKTTDVPSSPKDQNYSHLPEQEARISQVKTTFAYDEISDTTYTNTTFHINTDKLQTGVWKGVVTFKVTVK